jgi:hypothetical protein
VDSTILSDNRACFGESACSLCAFVAGALLAISPAEVQNMTVAQVRQFAVMFVVLLTVACGGDSDGENPVGPNAETPGITNTTDNFQFHLPDVSNYSTNGGYTWRNNGTAATVTQNSSLSSGSGTLIVRDAGGRIVYSRNLNDTGNTTTESGPSGDWRIEVTPSGVNGTISFRVQRN